MAALAVVEPRELKDLSLVDLAEIANHEHHNVVRTALIGLEHAICAGEAIDAALNQLTTSTRVDWIKRNFAGSLQAAYRYRRIALNANWLRESGVTGIAEADVLIRRHRLLDLKTRHEDHHEARRFRQAGCTYREIGIVFGVSTSRVYQWLNPTVTKRQRARRHAAAKALEREGARKQATCIKGPLSDSYALTRKLGQRLQQAHDEAPTASARQAIARAQGHLLAVEEEIVTALTRVRG